MSEILDPILAALDESDEAAGKILIALWLNYWAGVRGVSPNAIPEEFAYNLIRATRKLEVDEAPRQMPMAAALRRAARGEFVKAGKLVREVLGDGTNQLLLTQFAAVGMGVRRQRKVYSRKGNESKKANAKAREGKWRELGSRIRKAHPKKSNLWLATEISKRSKGETWEGKASTIRSAIKRLGLGKLES